MSIRIIIPQKDTSVDPMGWTHHFVKITGSAPTVSEMQNLAHSYVNALTAVSTTSLDQFLPQTCDPGANVCQATVTDITTHLDGTPAGSPAAIYHWSLTGPTSTSPVPEGCAGVLTYQSDYGTDPEFVRDPITHKVTARPRARDRSRTYFPIGSNALTLDATTKRSKLLPAFVSKLITFIQVLGAISDGVGGVGGNTWKIVQWSKKLARIANVVGGWVDDRPDYQRRRTDSSALKTTYAVTETGLMIANRDLQTDDRGLVVAGNELAAAPTGYRATFDM
jgi:hypothetical protein